MMKINCRQVAKDIIVVMRMYAQLVNDGRIEEERWKMEDERGTGRGLDWRMDGERVKIECED